MKSTTSSRNAWAPSAPTRPSAAMAESSSAPSKKRADAASTSSFYPDSPKDFFRAAHSKIRFCWTNIASSSPPVSGLKMTASPRERMLLRSAAAAASQRLVVSYPRMDVTQARARVPSFYALEVVRAAEGRLPSLREFEKRAARAASSRLDWPAPANPRDAIDDAEYDLASLQASLKLRGAAGTGSARYLMQSNHALAPIAAHSRPALAKLLVRRRRHCRSRSPLRSLLSKRIVSPIAATRLRRSSISPRARIASSYTLSFSSAHESSPRVWNKWIRSRAARSSTRSSSSSSGELARARSRPAADTRPRRPSAGSRRGPLRRRTRSRHSARLEKRNRKPSHRFARLVATRRRHPIRLAPGAF